MTNDLSATLLIILASISGLAALLYVMALLEPNNASASGGQQSAIPAARGRQSGAASEVSRTG